MHERTDVGIIFDMDGVLVDSADAHFASWRRLGEECDYRVSERQCAATFGRQNRDIIPLLFGEVDNERLLALADRKEEIYRDLVRDDPPIVDGAVRLVRELSDAGARLAIGSSAPRENIDLILAAMEVTDCFSTIVSGGDVTRGKPDPQVFTLACDALELSPSRCVVIEDAPAGIAAAVAAGTKTVAVLIHHPRDAFPPTDLSIARLGDVTTAALIALAAG